MSEIQSEYLDEAIRKYLTARQNTQTDKISRHHVTSDKALSTDLKSINNYIYIMNPVINHPLIPSLHISCAAFLSYPHQAKEDPAGCNGQLHLGKTLHRVSRPDPDLRR